MDEARSHFSRIEQSLVQQVPGQARLLRRLLVTLLAGGHVLIEGPPGVGKTRAVRALAKVLSLDFARMQFTPDLLPSDLTGSEIWQGDRWNFVPGPVFHSLLLADEINRAPAKVQSALLEAMAEGQVSVGGKTYPLPPVFMVLATQNPIEQEGTYALPEAQLDRFMMKVSVSYPDAADERAMLLAVHSEDLGDSTGGPGADLADACGLKIHETELLAWKKQVRAVHVSDPLRDLLLALVRATRDPGSVLPAQAAAVRWGASPRSAIALERAAQAWAWLEGRDFVTPQDLRSVAVDVLAHRLVLSWEAQAHGTRPGDLIDTLFSKLALA